MNPPPSVPSTTRPSIPAFNALIANVKVSKVNFSDLQYELKKITRLLQEFIYKANYIAFEQELVEQLNKFNKKITTHV